MIPRVGKKDLIWLLASRHRLLMGGSGAYLRGWLRRANGIRFYAYNGDRFPLTKGISDDRS